MKLYCGIPSPYSRKVRVVAHELDVPLELVPTNAMAETGPLGTINPINRVPALVLDSGASFYDSPVICEYLDVTYGPKLLPPAGQQRWDVLLRQALGDGLMDAAVPRRHETLRPVAQQSLERLRLYKRSSDQILAHLEEKVEDFPGIDIGTISIACGLAYLDFRFPDDNWRSAHSRLASWLDSFSARPSMRATAFS